METGEYVRRSKKKKLKRVCICSFYGHIHAYRDPKTVLLVFLFASVHSIELLAVGCTRCMCENNVKLCA